MSETVESAEGRRGAPASGLESVVCLLNAAATWQPIQPALFEQIDWTKLVSSAEYHGVLPVFAHRLLEASGEFPIDSAVRSLLRSSLSATVVRSFPLAQEVLRVSNTFRTHVVPVIPYKGPALAEDLWGSFSLRECSDLDFLVPPDEVDRAGTLLEELGYSRVTPIAAHLRPALLRNASEEQFNHRETKILLELQWAPAPRAFATHFDAGSMWSRTREIAFAGGAVLSPSAEDLLLLLCIHGWKHNWSRLIWVADMAQLIQRLPLDWRSVFSRAKEEAHEGILALGVCMAQRCFQLELPDEFVPNRRIVRLAEELTRRLQSDEHCSYVEWHRYLLAARDSYSDRIAQVARFLLTPGLGEYGAIELPAWASSGYRFVRLARGLRMLPGKTQEQ